MHTWQQFTFLHNPQSLRPQSIQFDGEIQLLGLESAGEDLSLKRKTLITGDPFPEPGATVSNQSQGY
jgi:hypothetical protein